MTEDTYKERMDFACALMKDYPGAPYYGIAVSRDEVDEAMAYAKKLWPDANVKGTIIDDRPLEYQGVIQVYFNDADNND